MWFCSPPRCSRACQQCCGVLLIVCEDLLNCSECVCQQSGMIIINNCMKPAACSRSQTEDIDFALTFALTLHTVANRHTADYLSDFSWLVTSFFCLFSLLKVGMWSRVAQMDSSLTCSSLSLRQRSPPPCLKDDITSWEADLCHLAWRRNINSTCPSTPAQTVCCSSKRCGSVKGNKLSLA